jgi:hypothetical protein
MMEYISVNLNNLDFCNMLKTHIENKTPLSMTRFGDGEVKFMNRNLPRNLKSKFCEGWGYKMSNYKEGEDLVVDILTRSLKNTDVLGFMDLNNDVCRSLKCKPNTWSLPLSKLKEINRDKELLVCDHQISRSNELGNILNLKKILNGNDIHIVSPRTENIKRKKIDKILGCNVYYTQINFNSKMKDREKMFEKVDEIKENIIIESLGLLGKDVPHYLASKGKICLDFGATIDAWCGVNSRPWFKGLQKHLLIK